MRRVLLATLVLVALSAQSQMKRVDPGAGMGPPPGTRDLQLPPDKQIAARPTGPMVDVTQLQKDALEMATLSASINNDMDSVNKGMLPKDIVDKLKRIEKLSKHLRDQLTQH